MRFTIIAVGKLKERFWVDACAEYLKRLQPYVTTKVIEVPDSQPTREEGAILRALNSCSAQTHVILLAIEGPQRSSDLVAKHIDTLALAGTSEIVFIIGGSNGVTETIQSQADEMLSFGAITLPHNLARVVLLEQLYRACKIIRGEPYHK